MSSRFQVPHGQVPHGPPWEVDVVADVHAGVYPAELTAALLHSISADPQGAAILAALDSTVDELSLLPSLVMPERYVLRMDAVLADLALSSAGSAPSLSAPPLSAPPLSAPPLSAPPLSTQGTRATPIAQTTQSTRAGIGALLQSGPAGPGRSTAPPGLPRPQNGPQNGPQHGPPVRLPRQTVAGSEPRRLVPPHHGPVIPRVLPGGPHHPGPAGPPGPQGPSTPSVSEEPTRRTAVADLQTAREGSDGRPTARSAGSAGPAGMAGPAGSTGIAAPRPRVGSLEAQRAKRRRWTGGLLAAAAVVAIGGVTALALNRNTEPAGAVAGSATSAPVTVPTQLPTQPATQLPSNPGVGAPQALVLEPGRFGDQLNAIEGKAPLGDTSLTNPATYASCLAANDITGTVTGVTEVSYQGRDAYAIAVNVSATSVRIVVVGTQCGQNGMADTLDSQTVTR